MRLLVLPGDGIGEEITDATVEVLKSVNARFDLGIDFEFEEIGFVSYEKFGTTLRDEVLEKAAASDGILLGPISHMDYPARDKGGVNISAAIRVKLDLYANIRPAKARSFLPCKGEGMDLVIMREATEGFYPDRNMAKGHAEFMPVPGVAISMRKLTEHCCDRIARRAFELAMKRRKKVTAIHKANNFIISDGMFLEVFRKVSKDFPEVAADELIIDASAAWLVRDPTRFDVICATNFYADILSDLASELSGSLGLAGSVNANSETGLCCAQAQHGSAPDIAGKDLANPTSLILSAAMMLQWLAPIKDIPKLEVAGSEIERAIDVVLSDPDSRTADLGGPLGTKAFGAKVAAAIRAS